MGYLTILTTFGVVAFAATCAFYKWNTNVLVDFLSSMEMEHPVEAVIARSWEQVIVTPSMPFQNIAVGVNGNVDLIVKGTKLLMLLDPSSNSSTEHHVDHTVLRNVNDLKQTFGFFHERGAGGERHMNSYKEFKKVLEKATSMPDVQYFIGGNAALMAQSLASSMPVDGKVMIGCPVGPVLKPLLHPRMEVTPSSLIDQDEYHMILEYSRKESWDGKVSPIASRFIFSHDMTNSKMATLEGFISSLQKDFQADLVILSGFHLLEGHGKTFWSKRLVEIAGLLKTISRNVPIHVELASMSDASFVDELSHKIFPLVNSIGLNEQELWLVCQTGQGPHCQEEVLEGPPPVSKSADVSFWMLHAFSSIPNSRLSRIHFHTLTYHIALATKSSPWQNQASSVLAGTRIAALQACGMSIHDHLPPDKVELRLSGEILLSALADDNKKISTDRVWSFKPEIPVKTWFVGETQLNLSPVLVCRHPVRTVGLGDAISASGLLYSSFVTN